MLHRQYNTFYIQKVTIQNILIPRLSYFLEKINNRNTLHYGCADWPIYNEDTNLHLQLCKYSKNIDGFDIDKDTIMSMINSNLYRSNSLYYDISNKIYDFILVPETIEHVNNCEEFLISLLKHSNDKTEFLITAPNAFSQNQFKANQLDQNMFYESVHPDHNYWFSPYTLCNILEKSYLKINKQIIFKEVALIENSSMVSCHFILS